MKTSEPVCSKCGQSEGLHLSGRYRTYHCYKCRYDREFRRCKGVREYQHVVNYFLALDNSRGIGYYTLSKQYRLEASGIKTRIKTWNSKYYLKVNLSELENRGFRI